MARAIIPTSVCTEGQVYSVTSLLAAQLGDLLKRARDPFLPTCTVVTLNNTQLGEPLFLMQLRSLEFSLFEEIVIKI